MRSPAFRGFGLFTLAILFFGSPGVDVNHGVAHESGHDSHADAHAASHADLPGIHANDHADDHGHPSVDSGLRERSSASAFIGSAPAGIVAARVVHFVSPLSIALATQPGFDHSTGPPPRLRAPPTA